MCVKIVFISALVVLVIRKENNMAIMHLMESAANIFQGDILAGNHHIKNIAIQMPVFSLKGKIRMSKAKYKQGKQICSITEFDACEKQWYKWNDKTVHRSVLISLQYRTLLLAITAGRLFEADLIED